MKKVALTLVVIGLLFAGMVVYAEDATVLFDFENGLQGWEIPDWAYEKPDHVQKEINASDKFATQGVQSLEIDTEFPGGRWTGAIVEIMH